MCEAGHVPGHGQRSRRNPRYVLQASVGAAHEEDDADDLLVQFGETIRKWRQVLLGGTDNLPVVTADVKLIDFACAANYREMFSWGRWTSSMSWQPRM